MYFLIQRFHRIKEKITEEIYSQMKNEIRQYEYHFVVYMKENQNENWFHPLPIC